MLNLPAISSTWTSSRSRVAVDVAVDVDVEVFVAVDVAVDVDVDVDVTVDVEVEVCVPVGAAADVVPVAIDDRDGLGRASIDREGLGRFEPPAQDAATSTIAQAARETLSLPWRRNTPVIPYLQIPLATISITPRSDGTRESRVGLLGDPERRTVSQGQMSNHDGGRMSPSPLQGGQWVSTWPALLPIAMGSSDRRAHGTS